MAIYDPRKISTQVYQNLKQIKDKSVEQTALEEQKNQAVELYTYAATWGLLRLKGEELALSKKPNKQEIIKCFFKTLGELAFPNEKPNPLVPVESGIDRLSNPNTTDASTYLGLTGLALQVAREFSFWAEALYAKPNPTPDDTKMTTEKSPSGDN